MLKMNKIFQDQVNFWSLQLFGWLTYSFLNYTLFFLLTKTQTQTSGGFIIRMVMGFCLTTILRYMYNYFSTQNIFTKKIIIIIILSSFSFALFWQFGSRFIKALLYNNNPMQIFNNLKFVNILMDLYWDIVFIAVWSTLYFGIKLYFSYQHIKKNSTEIKVLTKRSEIQVLRNQLNPHFLFNSLNSIRALIKEDKETAKDMIDKLNSLLNYIFVDDKKIKSKIIEEIDLIKDYLSIEKIRFEEKLEYNIKIDKDTENIEILTLLIHPLVENAIKHGMKSTKLPLKVYLCIEKFDINGIKIIVKNSGKLLDTKDTGIGLENVKKRLLSAYPNKHNFCIYEKDGFVIVEILINNTDLDLYEN